MNRYDSYKQTLIPWVGEVPSHWKRHRIKYDLMRSTAGVWGEDEKGNDNDIPCFRIADYNYELGLIDNDDPTIRNVEKEQTEGRILQKGDLLIEKSGGGDLVPVGRVVRYNYNRKAICSNFIHSVTVDGRNIDKDFLYYYFNFLYCNKVNLLFFNQTTGIQNLKISSYLGQSIYAPPIEEQKCISSFLNRECEKINKLIQKEEERRKLSQELKLTVIEKAIIHGICDAPALIDSNVGWIGMVPKHWEIKKLKYVGRCSHGMSYKPSDQCGEEGTLVLRAANIQDSKFSFEDNVYVAQKDNNLTLRKGDIIICSTNGSLKLVGKCAIAEKDMDNCVFGSFMLRYRSKINPKYSFYAL